MASRYGGRKVKRSKKLYRMKKSGFRKAIEAIVSLVVVAGLVFVGIVAGKALLGYTPPDEDPEPVNKPETITADPSVTGEPNQTTEPASSETITPPDAFPSSGRAVYAPSNVLTSSTALRSYLNEEKSKGCTGVVIEMKDEEGRLLYKSEIELIAQFGEIVTGTLTAKQIAEICTEAGVKPIARISTLKDHIATLKIQDISYHGWLDNHPEHGGKRWANPYLQGTVAYISEITAELYQAGFADVVFANTKYPFVRFRDIDIRILANDQITNPERRFPGLMNFVNAVSDSVPDAKIMLEAALSDFVDGNPQATAEILRNGGDSLKVGGVVLIFTRNDFVSEETIEKVVEQAFSAVKSFSGELHIIPVLDGAGLSESDCETIVAAFATHKFENYMIRN